MMTEQQADDLMLQIMLWEIAEGNQHCINCLSALTALCRYRDNVHYCEVLNYLVLSEQKTSEMVKSLVQMQTWDVPSEWETT